MATPVVLKALLDLSSGVTFNETSADCYDISDIVITANTRRGRSRELDKIEAGYAVITIIDENGDFNPDNDASPYYGKLKPGNKIRLYPNYNDGTGSFRYPDIFTGYVFNYGTRFSMGVNQANQITIEAYDAFKIFNSVSITEVTNSTTGDSSDERIGQILDEISWPAGLRTFETSALSLADDQGDLRTVLDAIRQVEDTEVGLVFVDGSGKVEFKNRTTANSQPDYDSAYKFSDDGTETSYNDLRLTQNDDVLINRVTVKSFNNSTEVTVFDSTSETTYFSRSAERGNVLLTSTTDLTSVANQLLANYKDSSLQIERIILNLSEYEQIDRVIAGLYFDIFEIPVWIKKTLPGNTSITRLGYLQGVNHDITSNTWLVTGFTGITSFFDPYIPNWLTALYINSNDLDTSDQNWSQSAHQYIDFDSNANSFSNLRYWGTTSFTSTPAIAKLDKNGAVLKIVYLNQQKDGLDGLHVAPNDKIIYYTNSTTDAGRVISYNNDLTLNWAKEWDDYNGGWARAFSDSSNNIFILGGGYNGSSGIGCAVLKWNSSGSALIENTIYDTSSTYEPYLTDAVQVNNHIYALYNFNSPYFDRFEIVKFNSSCEIVDQVALANDFESNDYLNIAVDGNDNKYVLGQTTWGTGFTNAQIIKINASNQIEWDKRYDDGKAGRLSPLQVHFTTNGDLLTLFYREISSPDEKLMVLGVLNTSGSVVESYKLANTKKDLRTNGFKVDSSNRIVMPVYYKGTGLVESATVINLKPELETLGTYTFLTGSDFVYGTWSLAFGTSGSMTLTNEVLSMTSETYTVTSYTPTITTITSDVTTIEFD